MDATAEILVQGGDSVATARRSSRTTKPTAKLQEKLQAAEKKTDMAKNMWSQQSHEGGSEGENGPADRVGESQMMGDATGNDASLMQTMLRGMLQETSTHLMSEQKQMLEPLGRVDGESANGDADMSEQLETIRQLQQEIQARKSMTPKIASSCNLNRASLGKTPAGEKPKAARTLFCRRGSRLVPPSPGKLCTISTQRFCLVVSASETNRRSPVVFRAAGEAAKKRFSGQYTTTEIGHAASELQKGQRAMWGSCVEVGGTKGAQKVEQLRAACVVRAAKAAVVGRGSVILQAKARVRVQRP
ncbi:hypothetical protein FOCG_18332 [Fusarium oxysporum f. sp. radicis-lycopersici 26381]|nr:hypothetical protein FOCG_18332 [Fusarium oxysporum f. sp. radicis-lycopersici 26381]